MKKIVFLVILAVTTLSVFAQQQARDQDINDFRAKKIEFLKQKMNMTEAEERAFLPVYNEFEQKKWQLSQQRDKIWRQANQNGKFDFVKMNDLIINGEVEKAKLAKLYYERFKRILPSDKLFKYYMAERIFKEKILDDFKKGPKR